MTAHELARKLLEGPDVPVVIIGHEPNDDMFDEVSSVDPGEAWQIVYVSSLGLSPDLHREPPRNPNLQRIYRGVRVIR